MDRCEEIVANVKMEERYAGMSLVFDGRRAELREEIEAAIGAACEETGLKPLVFDNKETDRAHHEAYYIEFDEEAQRDSGAFFTLVLEKLGIDHCVNEVIEG